MNILDGLKVNFDEADDGRYDQGVVIQTQLVENDYLFAIMDRNGYIHILNSDLVRFSKKDKDMIFNKPMEIVSKVGQAEGATSMLKRTKMLDIRF